VTCMLRGVVDRAVTIELRGGELRIEWESDDAHVFMTGPASTVFDGHITLLPSEPLESMTEPSGPRGLED
jgi:diaminopimelate epimerase